MILDEQINEISKKLNINKRIIEIALNRGILPENIESYLFPEKEALVEAENLPGISEACKGIEDAINKKQKILIYGDYDADGITSTALLYIALKLVSDLVFYYIPERDGEGYGLNKGALNKALSDGIDLVITVDCGIKSVALIKEYTEKGLNFIVTDHHTPDETIPEAIIVNPRLNSPEPFKDLAGVGVVYKLVENLCKSFPEIKEKKSDYLQLAAIGTIADLVNLSSENRKIIRRGIVELNNRPIPGIKGLINKCKIEEINSKTIAFAIAPIINSSGRMESPEKALKLLLSDIKNEVEELSEELFKLNNKRKKLVEKIYKEAKKNILENQYYLDPIIILEKKEWLSGVLGIVAAKLVGEFKRPSIVLSESEEGIYKGSARSIDGLNIFEALKNHQGYLMEFGGHSQAAGLTISSKMLDNFRSEIKEYAYHNLHTEDFQEKISADIVLENLSEINFDLYNDLAFLEPFGNGNPEPLFTLKEPIKIKLKRIGKLRDHLQIELPGKNRKLKGIYFNYQEYLDGNFESNIVFSIGINEWRNQTSLQLEVKKIIDAEQVTPCKFELEVYNKFLFYKEKREKDFTFIKKIKYNEICSKIQNSKSIIYYPRDKVLKPFDFCDRKRLLSLDSSRDFLENFTAMKRFIENQDCNGLITDSIILKDELLKNAENYIFLVPPLFDNSYLEIKKGNPSISVFLFSEEISSKVTFFLNRENLMKIFLFFRKEIGVSNFCGDINELLSGAKSFLNQELELVDLMMAITIFEELNFLEYALKNYNIEIIFKDNNKKNSLENSAYYYHMIQNYNENESRRIR